MNLSELSSESHVEMVKYLKFFRERKESSLRQVEKEFTDVKMDRLNEDMYSREDVDDILDFLKSGLRTQVSSNISKVVNMGALVLGQLLEDGKAKGTLLEIETSAIENEKLLEAVEKMSLDALPKSKTRIDALPSFKKDAKAMRDEAERLEGSNKKLSTQLKSLEGQSRRLSQEKLELLNQIETLREKMNESSESMSKEEDSENSERIQRLQDELNTAQEENEKRVASTSQFQQMKKIMQSQAKKIAKMRKKLEKYEPDVVDEEED